jgi:WD40 repeat protein
MISRGLFAALCLLLSACGAFTPMQAPDAIIPHAHSGGSRVGFNHDGSMLASGGWEGGVKLWQPPDGKALGRWRAHEGSVNGLAFLADGTLLTAGYDGSIAHWRADGDLLQRLTTPAPVTDMSLDEAADRIITGHLDGSVREWRRSDFALLHTTKVQQHRIAAVAQHPDGLRAAGDSNGRVYLWRVGASPVELPHPPTYTRTLSFTPDAATLIGAGWFRLFRWRLADRALVTLPTEHHGIIQSLQILPGGQLATISRQTDSAVYFLDPDTGAVQRRFQRHDLCGGDIAVSRDGRFLATTSDDASVRIWSLDKPPTP